MLEYAITREQHTAKEVTQIGFGLVGGILAHPIENAVSTAFKIRRVVAREIRGRDADAPLKFTRRRLLLFHQDAEKGSDGAVIADESNLVVLT